MQLGFAAIAISERNRVFVIKHRVEGERHKGSVPRRSNTFHQPETATTTATGSGSQGGGQEQK
ncbi:hypothetical protein HaLaN_32993, partial [Haematococcus lacustris]